MLLDPIFVSLRLSPSVPSGTVMVQVYFLSPFLVGSPILTSVVVVVTVKLSLLVKNEKYRVPE